MRTLPTRSVDAIITDPPAGISFMGKNWDNPHKNGKQGPSIGQEAKDADYDKYGKGAMPYGYSGSSAKRDLIGRDKFIAWMTCVAAECLRVLKPGGHALVWSLPRTSHWTATAWEDAGFEVRDRIAYAFGSGFPKSLDVSKAIDKAVGAERKVVGVQKITGQALGIDKGLGKSSGETEFKSQWNITAPATDAAKQWNGFGTALKPAIEDWWLLRKPLSEPTVAANVLRWGTGALNIDGCRVGTEQVASGGGMLGKNGIYGKMKRDRATTGTSIGRWPAHLIHDGSDEVSAMLSQGKSSAARFFYCAKPSRAERDAGCEELEAVQQGTYAQDKWLRENMGSTPDALRQPIKNHHPTVKAQALMRYLCRLITPPGGIVLDPFMGSGSTGCAARIERFRFIGIEKEKDYFEIARRRISFVKRKRRAVKRRKGFYVRRKRIEN